MSKIPLPERGQPVDLSYIYELTKSVNALSEQVSPSTYKYVTVETPSAGKQNVKASEARIIAGYVEVTNNSTATTGNDKSFSYTFPSDFKYAPVVTASLVNVGGTEAGNNVSVIIKSVTTSKVDGLVKYGASGNLSIGVNLIVVGIPN